MLQMCHDLIEYNALLLTNVTNPFLTLLKLVQPLTSAELKWHIHINAAVILILNKRYVIKTLTEHLTETQVNFIKKSESFYCLCTIVQRNSISI